MGWAEVHACPSRSLERPRGEDQGSGGEGNDLWVHMPGSALCPASQPALTEGPALATTLWD